MLMKRDKLFSEFAPVSTQEWMDAIAKDLKGADFNKKLVWRTAEGFSVDPFYRADNLEGLEFLNGQPGEFPFVRGGKTEDNDWEVRQDFRIDDINRCNALAREAAAKGAESVGLNCAKVETLAHMESLLQGIDVCRTGIHFLQSKNYGKTLDLFVQYLKAHDIKGENVYGSIDFDPLAYALLHGEFYQSFAANMDEAAELFKKFAQVLPKFRLLNVGARTLHEAGCYNVREIGLALSWGCEYLAALTDRGVDVDTVCARMGLHIGIGSDYFIQIAKMRTVRLLWAHMVHGFAPKNPQSEKAFVHAESSLWNQSVYDPYVNMLRSTTETMSAAIGGADSICVNDFSDALRAPDEFSSRIARNQQIILKEESFFNRIIDPAAGSYYIENLTAKMAEEAWKLFLEAEGQGGFAACVEKGFVQERVEADAAKRNEDLAKRKLVLTGVNQFPNLGEKELENLSKEICAAAAPAGKAFAALRMYRGAEAFEELRLQTEKFAAAHGGRRPKVFLLTCGNLAMRKARAGFASNFFGCLGYEIIDNAGFENGEQGAQAALKSGAEITVLCSSDEEYAGLATQACPVLKGKTCIVYAGAAADEEPFRALGVECFIHVRSNVLETLRKFQQILLK